MRICSPASSKAIALLAARWVASPTRTVPGWATRLERDGGVDEVAGDHALVRRADRDRGLAGQDAGPGLDRRAQALDRVDELERGPDGPLGVVLVGGRRAPDRHHGIADELLDGAAVAADHVADELEVAAQELAGVLGVAALGQGREADEVGEQDRDDPALGDGRRPAPARLRRRSARRDGPVATGKGRPAFAAELRIGAIDRAARPDRPRPAGCRTPCRTWSPGRVLRAAVRTVHATSTKSGKEPSLAEATEQDHRLFSGDVPHDDQIVWSGWRV